VVCSTNSDHLEILLAMPCRRTITGRGCLGERHRQYLILSPPATGKLCDSSLPDDFVINLECSPLMDESRTSSEKGSLSTAHGSYAILSGLFWPMALIIRCRAPSSIPCQKHVAILCALYLRTVYNRHSTKVPNVF